VAGRHELGTWRERSDSDLLLGQPVELDEVRACSFGDGEDVRGPARRPRDDGLEDRTLSPTHHARVALEGKVLDGEHRWAGQPRRDRMHEVRELGPQVA